MAQTTLAARLLKEATGEDVEIVPTTSKGDMNRVAPIHKMGRPGAFTHELEDAIVAGEIDAAVHSLKDMPVVQPKEAPIAAVLRRADPRDALIVHREWHDPDAPGLPLRKGARVGTSAPRRQSQLGDGATEAVAVDVRGNVETRLRLVADGILDALLMAEAPFSRVDLPLPDALLHVPIPAERYPGSPGQGAIAVQARAGSRAFELFSKLHHQETAEAVVAERRVLSLLGGGCGLPLGAWCRREGGAWRMTATFATASGLARVHREAATADALAAPTATALQEAVENARPHPPTTGARLAGHTVLVTLDGESADPYLDAFRAEGARAAAWSPTAHDALATRPGDVPAPVLATWRDAAWVLVASARAVPALRLLADAQENATVRFGAVGPVTARALRAHGFPVHAVSPDGTGAGLGRLLAEKWPPKGPVLIPGAAEPTPGTAAALRAAGVPVVEWPVYRTRALDPIPAPPLPLPVDVLLVGSPSAARALAGKNPQAVARRWVAIGPTTADALRAAGFPVHAVAPRRTPSAVVEVIA